MESQEVVPIEARAADGRSMVETTMRTMPVVVMKPRGELIVALLGIEISARVDPFSESGLNEAFGFTVGARGIGTGEAVTQAQGEDGFAEGMGTIAVAVVGEQAANANTQAGVMRETGVEESDGGNGGAVGPDLAESQAGMIVDGDVEAFPAGMVFAAAAAVGTSDHVRKAAQLFQIEMEQIAGSGMLIADQWHSRLQVAHTVEAQTAQDTADGGPAATGEAGNVPTGEALTTQLLHLLYLGKRSTARRAMRA